MWDIKGAEIKHGGGKFVITIPEEAILALAERHDPGEPRIEILEPTVALDAVAERLATMEHDSESYETSRVRHLLRTALEDICHEQRGARFVRDPDE